MLWTVADCESEASWVSNRFPFPLSPFVRTAVSPRVTVCADAACCSTACHEINIEVLTHIKQSRYGRRAALVLDISGFPLSAPVVDIVYVSLETDLLDPPTSSEKTSSPGPRDGHRRQHK